MEEKAVSDIMEILTQEDMTFKQAKYVFGKVQQMFLASSEDFLNRNNAKEVLKTRRMIRD